MPCWSSPLSLAPQGLGECWEHCRADIALANPIRAKSMAWISTGTWVKTPGFKSIFLRRWWKWSSLVQTALRRYRTYSRPQRLATTSSILGCSLFFLVQSPIARVARDWLLLLGVTHTWNKRTRQGHIAHHCTMKIHEVLTKCFGFLEIQWFSMISMSPSRPRVVALPDCLC